TSQPRNRHRPATTDPNPTVSHPAVPKPRDRTQLAGRASLIDCAAFPARLGESEPFRDLVKAMETALDLRHHRPGTLPQLASYLHERTAGRIGSLARLIRQAAITALTDGTERITKTTLEAIRLDHLAEQHYRPHTRPRSRSTSAP
ncbi:hypothetical protein ABT342_37985, partial [Streptomyces sp. NPDC000410]